MDDLNGQPLWAKPILSPHSHTCQVQPSQSHSFLLSGTKATQAGHSTWQDKDALTKARLPQYSLTWGMDYTQPYFSTGPCANLPRIPLSDDRGIY